VKTVPRGLALTLFQKRAWLELGLFSLASIALAIAVVISGLGGFDDNEAMRILAEAAFLFVAVAYGLGMWLFHWQLRKAGILADERDRSIVIRARASQLAAVVLALLAWTIALTEYYWDGGAVPVGIFSVIFFSVILVMGLTGAIAILVGYRRAESDV
jgi:peptidoglycan biosynthesis protein MviN/MurJ (putative lipid II flippase)